MSVYLDCSKVPANSTSVSSSRDEDTLAVEPIRSFQIKTMMLCIGTSQLEASFLYQTNAYQGEKFDGDEFVIV